MIEITAVPTRMRSAVGSSTLPTVDTWWKRRATNPSTQSVAPSTASRIGGRGLAVGAEEQPDEERDAQQPDQGHGVGDRHHPVEAHLRRAGLRGVFEGDHGGESTGVGLCQAEDVPRFEPFRGLRYDPGAVRLDQVIAPPYDVIGSAQRTTLAHRSPFNAVRVELPEPDLAAAARPLPRGGRAARLVDRPTRPRPRRRALPSTPTA